MIESAEQFRALRESEIVEEYRRAAHDEARIDVWLDVIARMPDMRFWVAQNKTVPVVVLERLADDADERVRSMVARKRKIPETLQLKLAVDNDSEVRSALARNAKVTSNVLLILADDHDDFVRDVARRSIEKAK